MPSGNTCGERLVLSGAEGSRAITSKTDAGTPTTHPKGIYFAKLTGGDEIHTFKIVLQ